MSALREWSELKWSRASKCLQISFIVTLGRLYVATIHMKWQKIVYDRIFTHSTEIKGRNDFQQAEIRIRWFGFYN